MLEKLRGYISKRTESVETLDTQSGFVMDGEEVQIGFEHQLNMEDGSTLRVLVAKKGMIVLLDHHNSRNDGTGHYQRTYWEPELPTQHELESEDPHHQKYRARGATRVSDLRYRVYPVLHYPAWDIARMYLDVDANKLSWYDDEGTFHEITYPT